MCNECLSHIEGDVEVTDGYQEPDEENEDET